MQEEDFEFFISLGENIIENANKTEMESVKYVEQLTPMQAFTLGVSLVIYGYEVNPEGCEKVLDKAIKLLKFESKKTIH